jgi:hypothetical protein
MIHSGPFSDGDKNIAKGLEDLIGLEYDNNVTNK